ncbi:hypothetical protein [Fluviispira multicolorata]|uniref:Polymer-forming protein n=1 Tax=Fluviispira multicolorata TaxID=2654512 RepID=A0A833N442_9BACT|nr:hypothetical protein [Fluviispira multicolorata]KAB8029881.1 hypothetical protein GCL57_10105 [Fluviispira multicolorata]
MKAIFYFTSPLLIIFITNANACNNNSLGTLNLYNKNVNCISNTGTVILNNVTVKSNTMIVGELTAQGSSINDLDVTGKVDFSRNTTVIGNINIVGELKASNTKFEKPISITSSIIELKDGTNTNNIYIRKNNGRNYDEFIYLTNSTVNGNITFESGKGKVVLDSRSKITGSLNGGATIYR